MKLTKLTQAASFVAALCLVQQVSAQDSHWNGTLGNNVWNISTNWNPNGVPPPGNLTTPYIGNVFLDAANGDSVITISPGDVEAPGVGNDNSMRATNGTGSIYNTIFGPEFGATLNVYGSLTYDWVMSPVQDDPAPGRRSYINLYSNSVVTTAGSGLGLGDNWWFQRPYVTMNMYSNAQFSATGTGNLGGLFLGGHLNIYDNSTFWANGFVNMDIVSMCNDGTRSIVVGGGTLIVPENSLTGGNSGTVYDWIGKGILRAYGKGRDTNDLNIVDETTNIVVTAVPLGGALQRVYFLPLLKSNVNVGDFQQCTLVGDYPSVSGVLLSSSEPGLSPGSFAAPAYTSSNPKVFTVDGNGLVTAVGYGTATLTATVGAFSSTNSVSLTVSPSLPVLAHRYSFSESAGATTTSDSVGGADGTLNGDATLSGTGQLVLSGNQFSSVFLPSGILSGVDQVTIETWATFPGTINNFANLFAFGLGGTTGGNYVTFCPHTGGSTTQANFGQGNPGYNGERDAVMGGVLDLQTNVQIVAVYHPYAGTEALYINGVQVASVSMFNNMIDPVAYLGPTYTNGSILNFILADDPNNFIGESLYSGDPGMLANVDEFRIYNNALTPAQIAADYALGPNQVIGTSTSVNLTASLSGTNVVLKWPTTSALVTVQTSSSLGAGAVWSTVASTLTTDGSGKYQMTVPATGSAQFFRLQQ